MGEKDISEKQLFEHNDVFADIVNVLLFNGREVVKDNELISQSTLSTYKADGKLHEIDRDVAKRWMKQDIRIACFGIENQTSVDPDMPLRVIAYDGAEYRAELTVDETETDPTTGLSSRRRRKERYPVVTLVLYFGTEKQWDRPKNLLGALDEVPEEFKPFVQDYRINLFEIAYLKDEQVKLFKSDFRIVADYFVNKRKHEDYRPDPIEFQHVQEVMQLLAVMTGDSRFLDVYYDSLPKGGLKNMCDVLEKIQQKGRDEGIVEGRAEGIVEGRAEGEAKFAKLMAILLGKKEYELASAVSTDVALREKCYLQYGIA